MNKMVFKYPLTMAQSGYPEGVKMPVGAEIIHVDVQYHLPCIWALVDPLVERGWRSFEIFVTGQPISTDNGEIRKYIGTVVDGDLIRHIFERIN